MSNVNNKIDQLKGYVEPRLTQLVLTYSRSRGLTKSQAVRRLVIIGLKEEQRRDALLKQAGCDQEVMSIAV